MSKEKNSKRINTKREPSIGMQLDVMHFDSSEFDADAGPLQDAQSNTSSKKKKRKKTPFNKKRAVIISSSVLLVLLAVYLGFSVYFMSHFYFRTEVNGVSCSGKTVEDTKQLIKQEAQDYVLTLKERNNVEEKIKSKDINLVADFDSSLDNMMDEQNGFSWVGALFSKSDETVPVVLSYDEELLEDKMKTLKAFDKAEVVNPVSAYIADYTAEDGYAIVPEKLGTKLVKKKFVAAVDEAIMNLDKEVDLDQKDCYKKPTYYSDSEAITTANKLLNKYVGSVITYTFGDTKEVVDRDLISQWLSWDDDFNITIDDVGVLAYVDELSSKYDTIGKTRPFTTSTGAQITITPGDYGWWMSDGAERDGLIEDIKSGETKDRVPEYYTTAVDYGEIDYGNSYVEINLSAQHLYLYSNGVLIFETDIVSGKPSTNHATPAGIYSVTYTERDATLSGENYNTPVSYWMPFNRDIGLHDATWQTAFGGDRYLTHGSLGCINMPVAAAATTFQYVEKGFPVILYN